MYHFLKHNPHLLYRIHCGPCIHSLSMYDERATTCAYHKHEIRRTLDIYKYSLKLIWEKDAGIQSFSRWNLINLIKQRNKRTGSSESVLSGYLYPSPTKLPSPCLLKNGKRLCRYLVLQKAQRPERFFRTLLEHPPQTRGHQEVDISPTVHSPGPTLTILLAPTYSHTLEKEQDNPDEECLSESTWSCV